MDARKRILTAALEVFGERGFSGASTREIAARAGVTQPLVHYHFATKDALWRAAVDELFAALRSGVDPFDPDVVAAHADMVVTLLLGPDGQRKEEELHAAAGTA